jgi:NAD(P)H dehydrogenase (quinone)
MAKLLVTGASGHMGQRVVELLLEAGQKNIVATTRSPEKLVAFKERGVDVRYADFNDSASLDKAFAGVDRLLLISTDAIGTRLEQHKTAIQAAEKAGVKHVIYTSLAHADTSPVLFAPEHSGTEQALADSSMGWTILRNNVYLEYQISAIAQAYQLGGIFKAAGDGKTAYVSREDCARAAAAALASDFDGKRILEISGSEAVTQAELAAIVSSITGQELKYIPVELEAVIQGMVGSGLPRPVAEAYASFDTAIKVGNLAEVTNAVEELTEKKAEGVTEFLKAHKAELVPVTQ